jgi:hypothetical protein
MGTRIVRVRWSREGRRGKAGGMKRTSETERRRMKNI